MNTPTREEVQRELERVILDELKGETIRFDDSSRIVDSISRALHRFESSIAMAKRFPFEEIPSSASTSMIPCPDCANGPRPGFYVGFYVVETCRTCNGAKEVPADGSPAPGPWKTRMVSYEFRGTEAGRLLRADGKAVDVNEVKSTMTTDERFELLCPIKREIEINENIAAGLASILYKNGTFAQTATGQMKVTFPRKGNGARFSSTDLEEILRVFEEDGVFTN